MKVIQFSGGIIRESPDFLTSKRWNHGARSHGDGKNQENPESVFHRRHMDHLHLLSFFFLLRMWSDFGGKRKTTS